MIPWQYKLTWDDGRTLDVSIRTGDVARFESQMHKAYPRIVEAGEWTSYCDLLLVHLAVTRMRVEPVQTLDEFLDTVDIELVQYGEAKGKARGRAASSG